MKKRVIMLKLNMEEKEKKKRDADEKERLLRQLQEHGGLWDLEMVEVKVKNIPNEKDKKLALKIQLNFRQKVIGVKCEKSFLHCRQVAK